MFTLGYSFRPWKEAKSIADGPDILSYIRDTARDHGVVDKIRFGHKVVRASWSSADAKWSVEAERTDTGEKVTITAGFLFTCTGYYDYDEGFTPAFAGTDRFKGDLVHPQHWPEALDYTGKRVVVIGSGATAITLVPAMAERAAHVTMLQRSPSYVLTLPAKDPIAQALRWVLPDKVVYPIVRWKNVFLTTAFFNISRHRPRWVKAAIRQGVKRSLPKDYPVDTHFRPKYNPWDQRVCLVPDKDLFKTLSRGDASIVTDEIKTFTEDGIELASGDALEADVIVTATGLNMLALGGLTMAVDGEDVELNQLVGYKGIMFSGIPNFALAIGYTNASWTLKCDLACEYVCRLLNHMDAGGYDKVVPTWTGNEEDLIPMVDLMSGYVLRSIDKFPKQGPSRPWRLYQNYAKDIVLLKRGAIDDGALRFSRAGATLDADLLAA
jgi:monooxygenase